MKRLALGLLAAALLAGVAALAFALFRGPGGDPKGGASPRPAEERGAVAAPPAAVARPETPAADPPLGTSSAVETGSRGVVGPARPVGLPAGTRQSLSGRVVGAGSPVAGAQVLYETRDGTPLLEVTSDARGAFEIAAPYPLEDGLILIRARGFAPLETGPHAIRGGERRFVGNLEVSRGVPLAGKVTDASGTPIAGAQVNLRAAGPGGGFNRHVQRATGDEAGRFRFPDAPRGDVLIEARAQGFGSRAQDLQHGAATDEVTIELLPERQLLIEVRDARGAPVPEARVHLRPHDPRSAVTETTTDAAGIARATGLGSLVWEVRVEAVGYRPGILDRVEADGNPLAIELSSWPCIRGRVVQRDGSPPPSGTAVVALSSNARGVFLDAGQAPTPAQADGTFSLCDLRPGVYVVQASAPGFAPTSSGPERVTLGGGVDGVRIELETGGALDLLVQREEEGLAGVRVELYDRAPPPSELFRNPDAPSPVAALQPVESGTTGPDGHVLFERLARGQYWCLARANGLLADVYGPVVVGGGFERVGPLRLVQGGRLFGTLLGLPAGARDPVVNVFGEGGLTQGVPVVVQADASGAWSSPLLPPGNYRVTARVVAGEPATTRAATGKASLARGERTEVKLTFE